MNIPRFDALNDGSMEQFESGQYVRYEDYVKLFLTMRMVRELLDENLVNVARDLTFEVTR